VGLNLLFCLLQLRNSDHFLFLPLGITNNGKASVLRVPGDETGRFFSGLLWKMMNFAKDKELNNLMDIFDFTSGQLTPGLTPTISIPLIWGQYLSNYNPIDNFRMQPIIDRKSFEAGGYYAFKKMVQWTMNQTGQFKFMTHDPSNKSTLEGIFNLTPIVNRFIKISDYGETEKINRLLDNQVKERAEIRIKRDELLKKKYPWARKKN
jgi:hypothetical protein